MKIEYNNYKPKVGDRVIFNGWTKEQVRWGGNSTPNMLVNGLSYIISKVEPHRSHTKVCIDGVDEKLKFNSVHFKPVMESAHFTPTQS